MEQETEKIFEPARIIKIPNNIAQAWKAAGASLWNNNGIPFPGNAYLTTETYPDMLDRETEELGIKWRNYAEYHDGYTTFCFGFHIGDDFRWPGIEDQTLEICSNLLEELGIEWCGWTEPPFFELIATEQQIRELEQRLQEPIAEWKQQESLYEDDFSDL